VNTASSDYKEYFEGETGSFSDGYNSDIPEPDKTETKSSIIDNGKNITEKENLSGNKNNVSDTSENNTGSDTEKKTFHFNSENRESPSVLQNFNDVPSLNKKTD